MGNELGVGLLAGKLVGVFGSAMLAVRLGLSDMPAHASRLQLAGTALLCLLSPASHAEVMLQYFNTSWREITEKMPELAEAGYGAMWLPPPTKGRAPS